MTRIGDPNPRTPAVGLGDSVLLDLVLAPGGLSVVFQPILEVAGSRRLHSLECLVRGPEGSHLKEPDILFDYVRRRHEETRVDRHCVICALRAARSLPGSPPLSLNIHASTLSQDPEFWVFLGATADALGIALPRLTVEIVEHGTASDWHGLAAAVDDLRSLGVAIALDDIGHGQSNFRMILDCQPDLLKIDRYFVKGCSVDRRRQAVLEAIQTLAVKFDARVVAEGVETDADLETVRGLGISLVQGHLLSRPLPGYELAEGEWLRPASTNEIPAVAWAPPERAESDPASKESPRHGYREGRDA